MSLDVSVADYTGWEQAPVLTKADFVAVDEAYRYAGENTVDGNKLLVYVFDASDAYKTEAGKLVFDPSLAVQICDGSVTIDQQGLVGSIRRLEFTAQAATSLAVLVLANVDDVSVYNSVGSKGDKMSDAISTLRTEAIKLMTFNKDAAYGETVPIPMWGWKLFGDLQGETDLAAAKLAKGLKFYRNMSTPLTKTGFASSAAVDAYYAKGFVADEDLIQLQRRLSRIHLYTVKGISGKKDMTILSAKVNHYYSKIALVPGNLSDITPFDEVSPVGSLLKNTVDFREISTGHWVAYVPESKVTALAGTDEELYLTLEAKVDGTTRTYLYTKEKVTVSDPSDATLPRDFHYAMPWLRFCTQEAKVDVNGDPVAKGTYFNLIGNYSYEWVAAGIEE